MINRNEDLKMFGGMIPSKDLKSLENISEEEHTSLSWVVRKAVRQFLEKQK